MTNEAAHCVDEIAKQISIIAHVDWKRWTMPEFLELIDEGEEWIVKMRKLLGDYET